MNQSQRVLSVSLLVVFAVLCASNAPAQTAPLALEAYKSKICTATLDFQRAYCRRHIDKFDRMLNVAFRDAVQSVSRTRELRSTQLEWLITVRDACTTAECAAKSHVARVLALNEITVRSLGRREVPMDSKEQRDICEGIAALDSKGQIADQLISPREMPDRGLNETEVLLARRHEQTKFVGSALSYFSLPVRRDADFVFADVFTGGTCSSTGIRAISTPLVVPGEDWPSEEIDPNEEDDVIRWSTWGGGEAILMFRGRYFIVSTNGPDDTVGIVTWITPVGTRRPICALSIERTERSVSYARKAASLCAAFSRNEMQPLAWQKFAEMGAVFDSDQKKYLLEHGLPGAGMPGLSSLKTDIDNDGKTEWIARAQYDSGAGCGSAKSTLHSMTDDGKHLQLDARNDLLAGLQTVNRAKVEVYSYQGSQYVSATLNEMPALFRVSPSAVETECVFKDQPINRLKTLYPLDGAVRDPSRKGRD